MNLDTYRAQFEPKIWARVVKHLPVYGYPDTRIPGSKLVREYCRTCGDPIRAGLDLPKCSHCRVAEHPGQGSVLHSGADSNPWNENTVGGMEDGYKS